MPPCSYTSRRRHRGVKWQDRLGAGCKFG
ncbi:hypothetical protein OOU_Y34scaffold00051g9 [Pyricularia oryzae Y34]|uniref:Uncharacterized protein n=2 Tax=Pyricularia oryzae TaxID=318829 RepID=A0AA97PS06_PYRO3|nr:hypothetical protein OOU_Y34scaffold00051g9 [Pyricularia oryzae Y34]